MSNIELDLNGMFLLSQCPMIIDSYGRFSCEKANEDVNLEGIWLELY